MDFLYKYMSDPRTLLEDGFIRASQLAALNDPFEAVYCEKSLCRLVQASGGHGYESDKQFIKYVEDEKKKIGVISLTESNDNLLMWAHYANEHKGIALCLCTTDLLDKKSIFNDLFPCYSGLYGEDDLFDGRILKVKYYKQPLYKVSGYKHDFTRYDISNINFILFDIYQCKSDKWSYEKKHRIILRLEQADC